MQLTDELIKKTLLPYHFSLSSVQCDAIRTYIPLLLRWNEKISLTTVVNPVEILRFHFGESLLAVPVVPIRNGRLADVGSGAGFPGIALRLAVPAISAVLIESNTKKAAFLSEVVRELKLSGVEIIRKRMEDISEDPQPLDYVTARALGNLNILLRWTRTRLSKAGKLVLWVGEEDARIVASDLSWAWSELVHIPGSERRFILSGSIVD